MIDLNELANAIFTTKNIIIYLLVINILTFLIMWWDKHEARLGDWRVSEKALFIFALISCLYRLFGKYFRILEIIKFKRLFFNDFLST